MALGHFGPYGVRFTSGAPAYDRPIRVETAGGVLVSLFNDSAGLDPAPNPKNTDQYGNLYFYCQPGEYWLEYGVARIPIVVSEADTTPGGGATLGSYHHDQQEASLVWDVVHNLDFDPANARVKDTAGDIWYPNIDVLVSGVSARLTGFPVPVSGTADLS